MLFFDLVIMSGMHYDYSKRNYLLPHGCKDLIDVLNLEEQTQPIPPILSGQLPSEVFSAWKLPKITPKSGQPILGADTQDVVISDKVSILELSLITGQQPFTIIADLFQLGDFVTLKDEVEFDKAALLLKKYGFIAKRPF